MTLCMNKIWEEFSMPLKAFVSKRVSNPQDVEDILQDIFIKISCNADSLLDDTKIHPWIYQITRNTITDHYRKNRNIEFSELPDDLANENDEDLSMNKELSPCLNTIIDSLPEKYKEVVILAEFNSMTQKEISEKTGLSLSGVKSRVQRSRKILKTRLLDCCNLEFDRIGNVIDYKKKSSDCKYC
ncbi:MAG: RNA polymerase sigma factor SigZ [Peptococcaceae bacterium]|nr:RNA polymerase sigma factor SigZ [Peptococcaceae bacterium]